jgi:hypothetical protein
LFKPPDFNLLLNVVLDQFKVVLVDEQGDNKNESVAIQLDGLQLNRFVGMDSLCFSYILFLLMAGILLTFRCCPPNRWRSSIPFIAVVSVGSSPGEETLPFVQKIGFQE